MAGEENYLSSRTASSSKPPGHQTLKSSVLSPVGGKLTGQYMVLNNLMVHYKKLEKAKPCIDSTPPKAWLARKKARDRSRSAVTRSDSVSSTTRTYRRSPVRQDAFSETVDYGDFGVATGTQTVRRDPGNTTTTAYPGDFEYGWGPGSASAKLRAEREHYAKTGVDMPKYDENDLIERHRNLFKAEEKPFTPRMLHNNRQASRLSTMSCYCPPRRLRSNARSSEADGPNGNDDGRLASNTVVASNGSRQGTGAGLSDTLVNDTLRSVDGRYSQATPTGVPPLNISLDADNIRWLKELHQVQASRAKLAKHAAHGQGRDGSPRAGRRLSNQDAAPGTATGGTTSDPVNGGGGLEAAKQRIGDDETRKYQDFLAEVTRDILDRGIYTNRGLRQVFDSHVEKRKDLRPSKMREMLTELERNLGLPPENESLAANDFGYGSTLRPSGSRSPDRDDFSDSSRYAVATRKSGSSSPSRNGAAMTVPNGGIGRPPRAQTASHRGGRRDSSGSRERELDDIEVGSPATPRRQQQQQQQQIRRGSSDVLTIDHNLSPHQPWARGNSFDETTSQGTDGGVQAVDDDDDVGYDEIDGASSNRRRRHRLGKTVRHDLANSAFNPVVTTTVETTTSPAEDKSGRRTRTHQLVNSKSTGRSITPRDKSGRSDGPAARQVDRPLPVGRRLVADNKSGRSVTPTGSRRNSDNVSVVTANSVSSSAAATRSSEKRRSDDASAARGGSGSSAVKKARDEADLAAEKLEAVARIGDDDVANGGQSERDAERKSTVADDDDDSYVTNEELLETLDYYQQKLEMSNAIDEQGHDSDEEDLAGTMTLPTAAANAAARRSPPVPSPRKRTIKPNSNGGGHPLGGGRPMENDASDGSVEVSDLDDF